MGGLSRHVLRQIFFFVWYRHCLGTKKAQKLSYTRRSSFSSLRDHKPEKVFQAKVDKSSRGRFIQGTHFSRKDWPQHPWPAGQAAFSLPGAFLFGLEPFFLSRKKKCQSIERKSQCVNSTFTVFKTVFISVWNSGKVLTCAFVSSCQYAIFLVLFLYLLFTWYCALRCEKYIGKK